MNTIIYEQFFLYPLYSNTIFPSIAISQELSKPLFSKL